MGVSAANIDAPENVPAKVMQYAGRMNGGDFKWTFDNADDTDYGVDSSLKSAVVNYTSPLVSIGGYTGEIEQPEVEESSSVQESSSVEESSSTEESSKVEAEAVSYGHNFTLDGISSDFYAITGNLSTGKGTVTYNGMNHFIWRFQM